MDKRHRYQFKFWLDASKDNELLLAEEVDGLKLRRQWQPTVRDALHLLLSLKKRKIDVLLELFPWIDDYFRAQYAVQDSPAVSEFARLVQEQTRILEHLVRQPQTYLPVPQAALSLTVSLDNKIGELETNSRSIFTDTVGADPTEVRAAFSAGMGRLFEEGDDDLWD